MFRGDMISLGNLFHFSQRIVFDPTVDSREDVNILSE